VRVVLEVGAAPGERQATGLVMPVEPLTVVARGQQITPADLVIDLEEEQLFVLRVLGFRFVLDRRRDDLAAAYDVPLVTDEKCVRSLMTGPPIVPPNRSERTAAAAV
jgi:hypothetical protein